MTVAFQVDISADGRHVAVLLVDVWYVGFGSFVVHLEVIPVVVYAVVSATRPNSLSVLSESSQANERKSERVKEC